MLSQKQTNKEKKRKSLFRDELLYDDMMCIDDWLIEWTPTIIYISNKKYKDIIRNKFEMYWYKFIREIKSNPLVEIFIRYEYQVWLVFDYPIKTYSYIDLYRKNSLVLNFENGNT